MENKFLFSNDKKDFKTLLKNCGFSPNFFNDLEQNKLSLERCQIKKTKSANDVVLLQNQEENKKKKKVYEAEDIDIFTKRNNEIENNIYLNDFNKNNFYNFYSYTTIPSQDSLNKNMNYINNKKSKYIINAYKSKYKNKYIQFYEINSRMLKEKNKYKLYHKCCYPNCNRTFSSSGWLNAHLKEHLKQIHNSKYCKLFEKMILNEKLLSNKRNNKNLYFNNNLNKSKSYLDLRNSNQSINNENTINNYFFYSGLNLFAYPGILFENENILNEENNSLLLFNFSNDSYKANYQ